MGRAKRSTSAGFQGHSACTSVYIWEANAEYFLPIHCLLLSVLLSLPHPFLALSSFSFPFWCLEINCTLSTHLLSENLVNISTRSGQHVLKIPDLVMGTRKDGDGEQFRESEESGGSMDPLESPH